VDDEPPDEIFRALGDPNRRLLLDSLHARDGQTLRSLERTLPHLTRFGVMRHLRVLEKANLVRTRRSGREKHHFLDARPIQLAVDRWIRRYC
jgi:DNA-binding transcriptional ArsR family regulator